MKCTEQESNNTHLERVTTRQYMPDISERCLQQGKELCKSAFLYFSTTDIWGHIILCRGDCPVHYRMFSSVPGLYPLDVHGHCVEQKCLQTLPNIPGGGEVGKLPPVDINKGER